MRASVPVQVERRLVQASEPAVFTDAEVAGLPDPVCRYLRAAIAPGTPLATAARIGMRGQIKLGRWLPFQAVELLAPTEASTGRPGPPASSAGSTVSWELA